MGNQIGIGVIGMGWMGQVHSRSYRAAADRFYDCGIRPRLVICADDVADRAAEARERFGFAEMTTEWQAVLEHPDVQVVNIAAPNFLHRQMALAAAAAGKHIFCEKPVGRSPAETEQIADAARDAGVHSCVGFNYRWAPMVQYARQLLESGALGRITHYRGRFFSMYGSNPSGMLTWRFDREKAGSGALGDILSHVIDMAHMLIGPVASVTASKHTFIPERPLPIPGRGTHFSVGRPGDPLGPVTNEDYVSALVRFANGAQGTFQACRAIFGPKCEMAFDVNGTAGALGWNFERMNELDVYLPDGESSDPHDGYTKILAGPEHPDHGRFNPGAGIGIGYEDLKVIEAFRFLHDIVHDQVTVPGFEAARALARVQTAIMHSWESGQWENVEIPS